MFSRACSLLLAFCFLACRTRGEAGPKGYGLRLVELELTDQDYADLNGGSYEKVPVAAELGIDGKRWLVKVNHSGKSTIDDLKKSFHVTFQGSGGFMGRKAYRLAAQGIDTAGGTRSTIGYAVFRAARIDAPAIEPVALYVNKEYAGLYYLLEPIDDGFFGQRSIAVRETYKATFGNADFTPASMSRLEAGFDSKGESGVRGTARLTRLAEVVQQETSPENMAKLEALVDVGAYLRYIGACVYLDHFDGYRNNYFLYFDGAADKLKIVPWDLDRIYEDSRYVLNETLYGDNALTKKLLEYPLWKKQYREDLRRLVTEAMPIDTLVRMIHRHATTISDAYAHDRTFAAHGRTAAEAAAVLEVVVRKRHAALISELQASGD